MKQRKLTTRFVIILLILVFAVLLLRPTFLYETVRRKEEENARWIAHRMGVSYAYVIENLNRDASILRDKLAELELDPAVKDSIAERLKYLQDVLNEKALKYRKKAIKRGLDLQGGMHIVLEVDLVQLMRNLARQHDPRLDRILKQVDAEVTNDPQADINEIITRVFKAEGIRLSQYFGEPGESDSKVLGYLSEQAEDAIDRSLEILRNRIDQFGVSEPSIQKHGSRRIVLELPGVQDPARARDLIGRTALLEFKLLADGEKAQQFLKDMDAYLAAKMKSEPASGTGGEEPSIQFPDEEPGMQGSDSTATAAKVKTAEGKPSEEQAGSDSSETAEAPLDLSATAEGETAAAAEETTAVGEEFKAAPFTSLLRRVGSDIAVPVENINRVRNILADPKVDEILPEGTELLWSAKPEKVGGTEYSLLYLLKADPELTGKALTDARVDISSGYSNPGSAGKPIVNLQMNRRGARKFARVTGANVDKRLAIVLDDRVYMAPVIRSKIPNGRAIIEGMSDIDEANDIAIVLRAGALPTSVVIEEERTVGPSLGRDSIRKGQSSVLIGIMMVIAFMAFYYGMSGVIADFALCLNIVLIFSGLAFFGAMGMGASLSLPGIAGIILTIGMSVDANVLIFERIREELATGKTVWHAIAAGYDRAFTTILDANVTTLIAALVLLQFGTGPIKGFAVTLSIGIVCSFFTAIVVTRLIFDFITSRRTLERLSI